MDKVSEKKEFSVVVVDDQSLFREGLTKLIHNWPRAGKISEAEGGLELLQILESSAWDIILLDLLMPSMDGLETLRQIRQLYPEQKVMILTQIEDETVLKEIIGLGISGFILKNIHFAELTKALDMVADGFEYFTSDITRILYKSISVRGEVQKKTIHLNDREIEVLKCSCMQMSVEETAAKLFLSASSVKKYKMSLLEKTGSKNSVGLFRFALEQGIVSLNDL
jgi:DNA-binding NarL/FixJ family response regulator